MVFFVCLFWCRLFFPCFFCSLSFLVHLWLVFNAVRLMCSRKQIDYAINGAPPYDAQQLKSPYYGSALQTSLGALAPSMHDTRLQSTILSFFPYTQVLGPLKPHAMAVPCTLRWVHWPPCAAICPCQYNSAMPAHGHPSVITITTG